MDVMVTCLVVLLVRLLDPDAPRVALPYDLLPGLAAVVQVLEAEPGLHVLDVLYCTVLHCAVLYCTWPP